MKKTARDTALSVLTACRKEGAWSDGSLKNAIKNNGLSSRDAALATHICYGVLQNRSLLDFYISQYCTQKAEKLQPTVLDILRIGAYQMIFMDKIPHNAAVNEAVEMTKRSECKKAFGLVNAVLRKISANVDRLPELPKDSKADYLALRYSHPKWLVERILGILGEQEAEEYLACCNEPVPMTAQVNTLRTTRDKLLTELHRENITAEAHPYLESAFQVTGSGNLETLAAFRNGEFTVQDTASRLAVMAADPKAGDKVLDACAAPGGKSFAAAMLMENEGSILSCDIHPHKLKLIENGAKRLGIHIIETALADGKVNQEEFADAFDVVICDAPCSGLGIIRKKPDVRYKDPVALKGLPAIQKAILENVSSYVKPGGTLLYSTCTILPEENEEVTEEFLHNHSDFTREIFTLPGVGEVWGQVTLWPQRYGTDGFYICKMRRNEKG
ncbi:MAG: 16S rRNA (cytosine(967)-C(5))-methyltransferase RsmB [Oscillospiraceae bacterium]|nr:16S rRNA (cytosine(967)-C(5))-methyltransferase RsmB [Oscillospiraceae bacterium]